MLWFNRKKEWDKMRAYLAEDRERRERDIDAQNLILCALYDAFPNGLTADQLSPLFREKSRFYTAIAILWQIGLMLGDNGDPPIYRLPHKWRIVLPGGSFRPMSAEEMIGKHNAVTIPKNNMGLPNES